MSASLIWLLDGIAAVPDIEPRSVVDLTLDSREVRAGSLFFALPGRSRHGLEFAAEAARAAAVVLWEPCADVSPRRCRRRCLRRRYRDSRSWWAALPIASSIGPRSQLRITGITGTNGKTTCAYLLAQCLERMGFQAAYMGTIGWGRIAALERPTLTTPDVVTLHRELAVLRASGCARWRWKCLRRGSISIGSMECASTWARSPI